MTKRNKDDRTKTKYNSDNIIIRVSYIFLNWVFKKPVTALLFIRNKPAQSNTTSHPLGWL